MKKVAAVFGALIMLFGTTAYAENSNGVSDKAGRLVEYVETLIDTPYQKSACQMFVRTTFEKCLDIHNTEVICCAAKAWNTYGVSESKNNIPIGATVYFSGSSTVDSYCGKYAGHVGIYLGDGYIAHDWGAKIIKTDIKYVTDKGYTYLGWGWQGKRPLTDDVTEVPEEKNLPVIYEEQAKTDSIDETKEVSLPEENTEEVSGLKSDSGFQLSETGL